jgi:hypothetical protein
MDFGFKKIAQRIVTDYAATLSRVGLNESEWLRNQGLIKVNCLLLYL